MNMAKDEWREAVLDECAIAHCGFNDDSPRATLTHLIDWHVQLALDPLVSEPMAKLAAEAKQLQEENRRLRDQLAVADDLAAVAAFSAQLATGNVRLNIIEDASVAPNTIAVDLPGGTLSLDVSGMFEPEIPTTTTKE